MGLWQWWVSRDGIDAGLSPGRGVWLQYRGGARLWLRAGTRQSGFTHSMMFFLSSCSPCQPPKQSGQPTAPIRVCLAISSKYTWQSLCTLPATTAGTEVLAWQQCTQYSAHCPSSHAKGLVLPERRHFENSLGAAGFTRLRSRATSARPRRRRNGLPVHRPEVLLNNLSTKKTATVVLPSSLALHIRQHTASASRSRQSKPPFAKFQMVREYRGAHCIDPGTRGPAWDGAVVSRLSGF